MTGLIETLLFTADVHSDEEEGEDSSISLMCIRAVGEIRRLTAELEHERKRLDWALANDAQYFMWDGEMTFCCSLDEGCGVYTFVRETNDPRREIDEFMDERALMEQQS